MEFPSRCGIATAPWRGSPPSAPRVARRWCWRWPWPRPAAKAPKAAPPWHRDGKAPRRQLRWTYIYTYVTVTGWWFQPLTITITVISLGMI